MASLARKVTSQASILFATACVGTTASNIVHVVDSLEFGGLERVVCDLAIAQSAAGHRVQVFSIGSTDGFAGMLSAAGVPVVVGGKQGAFDRQVLRRLRALALAAEVVHAHNFVPSYYAAAALLGTMRCPALVGTVHDMGMRLSNRRLRWLYRLSLLRTQRVAMVGRQVHERFVGAGYVPARRAETVLNGIPVGRFAPSPARRAAARRALGMPADVPVVGSVGRLVDLKNQRALIDALPGLAAAFPDVQLVLVGEGPLDAELRRHADASGVGGRVLFAGARPDVADLLPAFDVFALPSKTEGLSIALLEACASGLAVVATAVGGNPEVIRDGDTGRLVPPGDGDALARALHELVGSVPLRAEFGEAARAWVAAHASIEALRDAYDAFYLRAASHR